jgi:hypothetical protein
MILLKLGFGILAGSPMPSLAFRRPLNSHFASAKKSAQFEGKALPASLVKNIGSS